MATTSPNPKRLQPRLQPHLPLEAKTKPILCPTCLDEVNPNQSESIAEALYVCPQCGEILIFKRDSTTILLAALTPAQVRYYSYYYPDMWRILNFMSGEIKHFHRWQPPHHGVVQ